MGRSILGSARTYCVYPTWPPGCTFKCCRPKRDTAGHAVQLQLKVSRADCLPPRNQGGELGGPEGPHSAHFLPFLHSAGLPTSRAPAPSFALCPLVPTHPSSLPNLSRGRSKPQVWPPPPSPPLPSFLPIFLIPILSLVALSYSVCPLSIAITIIIIVYHHRQSPQPRLHDASFSIWYELASTHLILTHLSLSRVTMYANHSPDLTLILHHGRLVLALD